MGWVKGSDRNFKASQTERTNTLEFPQKTNLDFPSPSTDVSWHGLYLWTTGSVDAAAGNPLQLIWWRICLAPNGELFPGRVLGTHACMHPGADTRCAWGVLAMHTATHACMQAQTCVHAFVRARTHASPW